MFELVNITHLVSNIRHQHRSSYPQKHFIEIIQAIYDKLTAIESDSDATQQLMNKQFVEEVRQYNGKTIRINPWKVESSLYSLILYRLYYIGYI